MRPAERPSFQDIIAALYANGFNVVPRANCETIRAAVFDLVRWELDSASAARH
jgi:hypothetical protein